MGVLVVAEHLFTNLVKLLPLSQQIPQMLGQQALLRAGRKAVQHEHPLAGVLLLVFLGGQLGGIVAAGQSARDGDGIHLVGSLVGGQPIADVGAGGRGLALIGAQGLGHAHGIHRAVVQIFGIVGDDLQGNAFKIHALQGVQAEESTTILVFISIYLHSGGSGCRSFSCCLNHYISFSKTCQLFS